MLSLETLLAYLPPDRREAIAAGSELPGQTHGAALWADLSGFTLLTETLARKLGPRHGAEELGLHLNRFYDALIAPVDLYGGSVVGFSGDAVTCWFEADDGRRAIAAAQAMQAAMRPFASLQLGTGESISLGLKSAVCGGPVRRFQVGDPGIQIMDTLAGATMQRLALVGHLAGTGELLVDENTETRLHDIIQINKWRRSKETRCRAAVLRSLDVSVEPAPQVSRPPALSKEQIRPWLLPAVFARLQEGQGEFLTELRPAVALFMRFEGLDYDGDDQVGDKLDAIIRQVQRVLLEYDGTLLQLTIGDKGSYLYAAFGAPVAHEDDAVRAAATALEFCSIPTKVDSIHLVSIGLSRGVMRTGAYGGATRRTYGVLGDEVNLAARLMEHAAPGQVLASEAVWQATPGFNWQSLPELKVKGKRVAARPAVLLGRQEQETFHLALTVTGLPMIGRQAELALVKEKLGLARAGNGQIISIIAEAGMGKSRLLAEVLQRAGMDNLTFYGGECQSYGTQSSYLVWQSIWRAFFGINPSSVSPAEQTQTLEKALARVDPGLLLRLPLLGAVLNLLIPDNSLTDGMDAKSRKTLLETLLVECIRAWAGQRPLVLVLDDLHWIDPLSRDLLERIGQAIKELPVLVLLAYRPATESKAALLPGLAGLEYAAEVSLAELTRVEIEQLVMARLAHFDLEGGVPPVLIEHMLAWAQGNPFYIEELLNYLHDRGLDPRQEAAWQQANLPESLHSLILSRIDQLSERQQITLKAASIIGRLFRAAWLHGYYPALGGPAQVSADLDVLNRLEFILLETPEPQLAYLFKHVITQEVAYESLAYATRTSLHEQFARYLESVAGEDLEPFLDLLAYHYERSENQPKKRIYLRKAGEAAKAVFANEAALSYLGRALALAPETDYAEQFEILSAREQIYQIVGKREAQGQDLEKLSALAEALDDNQQRAQAALQRSRFELSTGNFPQAIAAAQQAAELAHLAGAEEKEISAYWLWGRTLWLQGSYTEARTRYEQALVMAEAAGSAIWIAASLGGLGSLDIYQGNYDRAQTYVERALQLERERGNLAKQAASLYNLGEIASLRGDFAQAQTYHEQALHDWRSIGFQVNEGRSLCRVGSIIIERRGDYEKAQLYTEQALRLAQELDDRVGRIGALYGLSLVGLAQNNYQAARFQAEQGLRICREIGFKYFEGMCLTNLGAAADELGEYASALEYHQQALSILRELGEPSLTSQILSAVETVFFHLGEHETALEYNRQALSIANETKNRPAQNRAFTSRGHALRELGNLDQAADSYRQALTLALELGFQHFATQAQAGLAAVALAQGNFAAARAPMDEVLNYLEISPRSTMDEIFWIYLTCHHILQANADPRARATLSAGHSRLQEIAARVDDQALRASFLQNVRSNRGILQAWENLAAS